MTTDYTTIDRIIAKIDNDFNPNNSDWIPRVGAWIHDALIQLDCIIKEKIKKELTVRDRIARSACELGQNIKVYDTNGCTINNLENSVNCSCGGQINPISSKGEKVITPTTITAEATGANSVGNAIAFHENVPIPYPPRYNVQVIDTQDNNRGYVRIDSKTFELNFDTDKIIVEYEAPKHVCSQFYSCTAPAIPDNGKLIEAITYYCMYKMLTRGYVHPVMNLAASQYGTNPYYIWIQTKDEAKRSVVNDGINENLDDLWRSAFYIDTFNPRGKS